MPRREDERRLNLSSRHPAACTCKDCTDSYLKKKGLKSANKRKKSKPRAAEAVKRHPAGCSCTSCSLLGSVLPAGGEPGPADLAEAGDDPKPGLIKKLFGKR